MQIRAVSATLFLVTLFIAASTSAANPGPAGDVDELLVGVLPGVSDEAVDDMAREEGASRLERLQSLRVHRVRAPHGGAAAVRARLEKRGEVEFVEPNALLAPSATPNDPEYPSEWHLSQIGAPAAWDITTGSPEVIVAILDSGIAAGHVDLQRKVLAGWNFYDGNSDTSDVFGHGTMVAGTAAAATDNNVGVAGVGWSSLLLPVRVTDRNGYAYVSMIASGLTWAVDHGARVMNVSFESVAGIETIRRAAQYVQSKGGMVVASAGNCSCDDPTPANPYILSVGATDAVDNVKSFSSRGAYVDLAAPGVMIRTTAREGDYVYIAGTSFSSPIVAGVVALMMAANPSATPADIESWLKTTALDIGPAGTDTSSGYGRVRADLAVAAAASASSAPTPADVTPPAVSVESPTESATVSGIATVSVAASDDRAVLGVDLYADGVLVGHDDTAPYSFAWDTRTVAEGAHTLVATAADAAGNDGSSSPVHVVSDNSVDLSPPTALILTPTDGTSASRTVTVQAQADDDVALSRLDVLVDGKLLGGVDCSGTDCTTLLRWNTKKASKGIHEIRAEAIDQAGNRADSAAVRVTVR